MLFGRVSRWYLNLNLDDGLCHRHSVAGKGSSWNSVDFRNRDESLHDHANPGKSFKLYPFSDSIIYVVCIHQSSTEDRHLETFPI